MICGFEQNLGEMEGPVLVFGGPYSNLPATRALKDQAEMLAIPPQRVICTGDVVAYCAEPQETARMVYTWQVPVVMGNCEQALADNAPDCGCGFGEESTCSRLSVEWYRYADACISMETRNWMASLPGRIRFTLGGKSFLVVHGGIDRINRFLFFSNAKEIGDELSRAAADVVLAGHCGIPFGRRFGRKSWLNAGAIGMPANDGTADGWYMLLEPRGGQLQATWHRLGYAARTSQRRMSEAGLKSGYAETLVSGIWPSQDILPPEERSQKGTALSLAALQL